jgi:signal transduction histidine kinase
MQTRLRASVVERTQLLAAVTHDLQTPMTRLRLRLEKVGDAALRSRLIDDLGVMQALIREGLDYARSTQTSEPLARLELDHLLELVVEDAAVGGKPVRLVGGCGCEVEVRPRALQRCLANLIDNAVKYGGATEVSAQLAGDNVEISIRDWGPGIPPDRLAHVFEPFVRVASEATNAIDGIGLGLAIARTLAERNAASLTLRNHPEGGLEARLTLKATGITATAEIADPA